ncbi:hypothetical protein CCAL9344_00905 [Campylobacter sp. RM9344]|uniref:Uncharacterized protein n=1 Tax=Campylobacter californiensis TaxID=1032243 RepID=A0AAW3ZXA8_9BACT|nr:MULTISPECIES: hypothetical protein [unclassified Campylobacter]MBE2983910.1 hypothetical protein [Campylobacter sp. RM6883]MBE2986072.1 hypothetical protein [Campylobacter sp. RM12919]MBE2987485.1 hypothetical protein [Campylobacter sp. RM12920]MBE2994448.1 hypothetical protein [Campylobacter sp. RM6913]MBE3022595.1 hypothetical protein [Campylobacter sp. 7477a]MBE3028756.1 hypothetical protein [Campylobacter sp. RM9344]
MKQITLTILSRDYTITLDDDFAKIFERDWQKFLGGQKFLDPKDVLNAFIEKCYADYAKENDLKRIIEKIDNAILKEDK